MKISDAQLVQKITRLLESIVKIRGGRGYSAGHPHKTPETRPVYGKSRYDYDPEPITDESDEPVEVSVAYDNNEKSEDGNEHGE